MLVTCCLHEVETYHSDLMIEKDIRFDYTDEYIELDQLTGAVQAYRAVAQAILAG